MRFFLDENFPKTARFLLAELGHETLDIRGTEQEGSTDDRFRSRTEYLPQSRSIPNALSLRKSVLGLMPNWRAAAVRLPS